ERSHSAGRAIYNGGLPSGKLCPPELAARAAGCHPVANESPECAMLESISRYLVPFDPKRVPHRFADVLVIGGGLAGLRAALAVPPEQSVLVITKSNLRQSNSAYAQGGIAGVIDPEDRFEDHIADTLAAGGDLCDPAVVEMVVREAPGRINELI